MKNKIIKAVSATIFWIGIWFLAATLINKELIFPSPVAVVVRLGNLAVTGSFWIKTLISVLRVLFGFITGCILGTLLAVISSASEWAEAVITPFIRMLRSTPVTSFIILVMLWISYDFVPVFIAGLMVAPVMFMNLKEGISETDKGLLEVARVFRFGRKKIVRTVYIPSVKPYFVSGAVTSLGLAWKAGIAAEVICLPSAAIGREMYYSKLYLETPDLFAWTVAVVLLSYIFEKLLGGLMQSAKLEKEENKGNYKAKNDIRPDEAGIVADELPMVRPLDGSSVCGQNRKKQNGNEDRKTVLSIKNLTVSYGDNHVIDGLSMDIHEGITCIMGKSGRGKTTLLNSIAGLVPHQGGVIYGMPKSPSVMFQDDRLFPWLTALENISVVNNDVEAAKKLLKAVELEAAADKHPSELSGGMRRRVALARTLSFDSDMMILDEPFKGLDSLLISRVAELIIDKDVTTLVATHAEEDARLLGAEKILLS